MKKKLIVFSILLLAVSIFAASTNLLQYGESNVNRDGVTKENSNHSTTRDILLDQQPNQVNGLFCDGAYPQVIAENFILTDDTTIEGFVVWGGYFPLNTPVTDNFTVFFHTDVAGAIGTMISTEVNVPSVRVQTGLTLFGVDEWMCTLTLATPVDLTAGTYWLEFYNTTQYPTSDVYFWETGDLDPVNGIVGSAWAVTAPGSGWTYDGATDLSIQLLGTTGGGTYCDATTTFEDEYIANVLCAEIDNTTGWQGGVADYTAMSATIAVGGSEDIDITVGSYYASDAMTCWVDWNDDYVWELGGAEEYVLTSDGTGQFFDGAIAVPAGTSPGLHRMRVRLVYSAVPDPCGSSSYGEVEDYSINVVSGGPANDFCADAEVVSEVTDLPFDTSIATASGFGTFITSNDLWYVFTAPSDGLLYVGLCDSGFDTKLALWGECDDTTLIDSNDDSCGLQSELFDVPVVAGEDYFIQVGGYGTSNGAGLLDVAFTSSFVPEPPTNLFVTEEAYATWDAPPAGATSEWLIYDTDVVGFSGIGAEATDYSLIWGSKWVPADLTAYDTGYVTKVAVNQYTDPTGVDYVTEVRVMSGDGMTVLYTQDVTGTLTIGWNEIVLDSAVPFDNTENLWIGMYAERPGGEANEPTSPVTEVILDRYDYFAYNGAAWTSIYNEYAIDNQAWMLRGFVSTSPAGRSVALGHVDLDLKLEKGYYTEYTGSTPTGNGMIAADPNHVYTPFDEISREFLGYNVYLDGTFVEFTTDLFYQYAGLVDGTTYLAGVTADYDEGESDPIDYSFTYVELEAPDVIISEYIEGSSNNKAMEIWNNTGDVINLDDFRINQSVNGGGWEFQHIFPTGATLADGDVWVLLNADTDVTLFDPANADEILTYPSVVHHNGDDARGLEYTADGGTTWTLIDIIGDPDVDPGSGWDVAGITEATQNHTLVRKDAITTGNTDWALSAGTNATDSEWIVYDEDTFEYLGQHPGGEPILDPPSNVAVDDVAGTLSWSAPAVGGVIYEDDLESYTVGDYLAVQSADWTTWSNAPGGAEDALISDVEALSGSNSVVVEGTSDLVLLMDNYTSGVYSMELNLLVPTGYCGYYNLQKTNTIGEEWAFQVQFDVTGIATVDAGAAAALTFPFDFDTWINMELVIDLDADWCDIYVDGVMEFGYQWTLGTFGTPGLLSLGGLNLFAWASAGNSPQCYFDDITLSEVGTDTRDLTGYNVYLDDMGTILETVGIDVFEYTYVDLIPDDDYIAGVSAVYDDGVSEIVEVPFTFNGTEGNEIVIAATKLHGNYPNPFNPVTNIAYSIKDAGKVTLQVYNIKGQLVKTLVNEVMETGDHTAIWNGKDNTSKSVSSGVYFYKMKTQTYNSTKKMILMK